MVRKNLIIYSSLLFLSGCIYNDEPMPRLTYEVSPCIPAVKSQPPAAAKSGRSWVIGGAKDASGGQMESLASLVRFLQNRYGIAKKRIYCHNTTPGARTTDCPMGNFPIGRLKSMIY